MAHGKCSARWLHKYLRDQYIRQSQRQGLRSRSWFKLDAINRMDSLFCIGMRVIDLGAAPGGWALYVKKQIGDTGHVIACDILPMRKIEGVDFLRGDCSDPNFLQKLYTRIGSKKVHIVLSDMSPNITGISIVDVSRTIYLGRIALDVCRSVLMRGGCLLVKVFQGQGVDSYICDIHSLFNIVKIRKPDASRPCSREIYIVAKEHKYN